jgi:hypothetical protein
MSRRLIEIELAQPEHLREDKLKKKLAELHGHSGTITNDLNSRC